MARKAPGRAHREGLTLLQVADMFRDEETARLWLAERLWPDGPYCPECGSFNVQSDVRHRTMTHRCRDCPRKPFFSVRKGTIMEGSKLPYRVWAVGVYLFTTNLKGISSMRLHRELGIGQKAAWFMLHRLRRTYEAGEIPFETETEVDETYVGGKKDPSLPGRGPVGKAVVAGAKERETKRVRARTIPNTKKPTLHEFVADSVSPTATVYTDELRSYQGIPNPHETVCHSAGEYVREQAHTNGIESFWANMKRGYHGVYHKMSHKHLDRYVQEYAGRHNDRDADTIDQMSGIVAGMTGKRLSYRDLIADNGLKSGARTG